MNNNLNSQIIGKYNLVSYTTDAGKIALKVYNNNAKTEWNKLVGHYCFRNEESRTQYIASLRENVEAQEQQKAKRKADRLSFVNPAKIGDILHCSWGYDQTNVDYYQVVGVKGKMVEVREIGLKSIEGSGYSHGMADEVAAIPNKFVSDQIIKKMVKKGYDGGYYISMNSYAIATLTDNKPAYRSWYA